MYVLKMKKEKKNEEEKQSKSKKNILKHRLYRQILQFS